ncbi:MAG: disulfide bond formation protein B [Gammaproteobacteria bacterium]|nr:disulfide bond formation protein B [Gammaproteobacteria bacterium]
MRTHFRLQQFALSRLGYFGLALACSAWLSTGYYLERVAALTPCPLCIFQRFAYFAFAVLALLAALHAPRFTGQRIYSGLMLLCALAGLGVAGRQTWLQHLPADRLPACGPDLAFMVERYAPLDVLKRVLRGSGDCAVVDWTFLGFSIAEWSLGCFASLICACVLQLWATRRPEWR